MRKQVRDGDEVMVIGPTYRDKQGNVKTQYPARMVKWGPHLASGDMHLVDDIDAGLAPDPLKSPAQVEADALRKRIEELEAQLAAKPKKEPKVKDDAGN